MFQNPEKTIRNYEGSCIITFWMGLILSYFFHTLVWRQWLLWMVERDICGGEEEEDEEGGGGRGRGGEEGINLRTEYGRS